MALVGFVGLCLLVALSGFALSNHALSTWFLSLRRPPGMTPSNVFGSIWAAIYLTIGLAGWLAWRHCGGSRPVRLWGWQLALNASWLPAFFALHSPLLALVILAALLPMIILTTRSFAEISRLAAWLMVPYAAWTLYSLYLTVGFCWLNPV